jgi:predicted N-formylglutamate amidohydrolase
MDCNRAPEHPHSIVTLADGWTVTGNLGLSAADRAARREAVFQTYHARIAAELDARSARGLETLLVCVHSFTPSLGGSARPWDVGILHMGDSAASTAMLALLRREEDLITGDNEPYAMDGTDHTAPFHAHRRGLDAVEIEVRQDRLQDPVAASEMARLFTELLSRTWERARGPAGR